MENEVVEVKEEEKTITDEAQSEANKKAKVARTLATIAFTITMVSVAGLAIADFVLFSEQIFSFIFGLFAMVGVFVIGIVFMFFSIIFIFGIKIAEERGFWPATWALNTFQSIMADAALTEEQIILIIIIHSIVLGLALVSFILGVIASSKVKRIKKSGLPIIYPSIKPFTVLSILFSILNIIFAASIVAIFATL